MAIFQLVSSQSEAYVRGIPSPLICSCYVREGFSALLNMAEKDGLITEGVNGLVRDTYRMQSWILSLPVHEGMDDIPD